MACTKWHRSVRISAVISCLVCLNLQHARADQDEVITGVRLADFSNIPAGVSNSQSFSVSEIQLQSRLNVSASRDGALYGTYYLGPAEARSLAQAIQEETAPVPAPQAAPTPLITFPGTTLIGESVLDTLSTVRPRRIPTVFAPFHAGTKFRVEGRESPPGTTLTFSNMTLLMPDVAYTSSFQSGFMDYFDLGRSARICFMNSIMVLESCEGYTPDTYHMWCCTNRQCNILYTQQALEDLGYDIPGALEHIHCVATRNSTAATEAPAPGPTSSGPASPAGAPAPIVQEAATTGVRVANFSAIPQDITGQVEFTVPEVQLDGTVDVPATTVAAPLYGAYYLTPTSVRQLAAVVAAEMEMVPASEATPTPLVEFPGAALRGESSLDTVTASQPLRIPTVFAPFHAGAIFRLDERELPPGVTLNFSNVTLLLPDATYAGIFESGLMDYFDLGSSARFCFTNSILALKSCKGYTPNTYHMWCCTRRQCNILYTQQAIEDLGYDTIDTLNFIQCVSTDDPPAAGVVAASSIMAPEPASPTAQAGAGVPGAGEARGSPESPAELRALEASAGWGISGRWRSRGGLLFWPSVACAVLLFAVGMV